MPAVVGPDQYKARAMVRLLRFLEAQAALPPREVALLLGVNAYALVQQSLENAATEGASMDERLQAHLRNVVSVLARAYQVRGDITGTLSWYHRQEIAEFANKTPETLTAAGRLDEVFRLIEVGWPPRVG